MFNLKLSTSSAAFEDDGREEVARLLEYVAQSVRDGAGEGSVRDFNGNTVGSFYLALNEDAPSHA